MNLRYKLFRKAISTKDQETYTRYKKVRNQVTSELRNARKQYFTEKIASAKSTAAYWNLLAEAANPVRRAVSVKRRQQTRGKMQTEVII